MDKLVYNEPKLLNINIFMTLKKIG